MLGVQQRPEESRENAKQKHPFFDKLIHRLAVADQVGTIAPHLTSGLNRAGQRESIVGFEAGRESGFAKKAFVALSFELRIIAMFAACFLQIVVFVDSPIMCGTFRFRLTL